MNKTGNKTTALPVDISRKLGMIKACGVEKISVEFVISEMVYKVNMDGKINKFKTDKEFYDYVDEKLEEVCNGKKL